MEIIQKRLVLGGSAFLSNDFLLLANFKPTISYGKYSGVGFRLIKKVKI